MKCNFVDINDDGVETCDAEATHDFDCTTGSRPVCANHKCRCSVTLEEAARREERRIIPANWMAL